MATYAGYTAAPPPPPAAAAWVEDDANADWLITLQKLRKAADGTPTDADLAQAARGASPAARP